MKNISFQTKLIKRRLGILLTLVCSLGVFSCSEFLEVKPDQSLVVPTTLEDVQSMLDNTNIFNAQPVLPLIASEEVWITDAGFDALGNPIEQATFTWQEDPFLGGFAGDWNSVYAQVFYSNVALDVLSKYEGERNQFYNTLQGSAYFLRAYAYLQLVDQFSQPFQKGADNSRILGIVIKESPDVNEPIRRSSLLETYDQIFEDLNLAVSLLPDRAEPKTRPTKAIALGALSRAYLNTFRYPEAANAAKEALEIYSDRLDFNNINVNASRPFVRFDQETIFYSTLFSLSFLRSNEVFVDSTLMDLYDENDLRKKAFFDRASNGQFIYTGKISGDTRNFGGLSVGELYLNAAEGYSRMGEDGEALKFLNELLALRYDSEFWEPIASLNSSELLERILQERRKELFGRGLRWMDLRRLNQEGAGITLVREVKGQRYELVPNSLRYTFPIPMDEITRSGIEQNPR